MTGTGSPFEALRLRAEADIAARLDKPQARRPSWAPPFALGDELFGICIKLGLLTADDKPIGRLWAQFASPKKVARVLREANRDKEHAMPGISCRGFELHAGGERGNGFTILLRAQRYGDGNWQTGPRWVRPDVHPSYETRRAQSEVDRLRKLVDSYKDEPAWQNPFREFSAALEKEQQALAKAQAEDQKRYQTAVERYELRCRATELTATRVAELAGDYDVQIHNAGRLCGHCCECFRLLTDPRSLEIGIGPECVQKVVWISPQGEFVRMIDAIADGRIAAVHGELRWVGGAP
ncbi:MAG TPA: DUF6011 domain-containing protein [Pseudolabrys sp.]